MNFKKIALLSSVLLATSIAVQAEENTAEALGFTVSDTELRNSWQLNVINAQTVWNGTTTSGSIGGIGNKINGAGVNVGVVDTGINNQFEYAPRLLAGYDFVLKKAINAGTDSDFNGHGSHVSGIIGAGVNNCIISKTNNCSKDVAGVAPGANLIPIRVLDSSGSGSFANVAAGINYSTFGTTVIQPLGATISKPKTDIVNISFYH